VSAIEKIANDICKQYITPKRIAGRLRRFAGAEFDSQFGSDESELEKELKKLQPEWWLAIHDILHVLLESPKSKVSDGKARLEMVKIIRYAIKNVDDKKHLQVVLNHIWQHADEGGYWAPMGRCWVEMDKILKAVKSGEASKEGKGSS
jgi:hypothetical protein